MPLVKPSILTLVITITLAHTGAQALPDDHEQPIHIEADRLEIDETRHISIYTGNVHLHQGSLNIRAQEIIMRFDQDNNLQHMDASGDPARFDQLNAEGKPVSGSALEIHYLEIDGTMELRKKARLTSDKDLIESEFIRTNTRNNALLAGQQDGQGRVRMLIQPRQQTQP